MRQGMENSIVYIHTTAAIIEYITTLSKRAMPNRSIIHILDESILYDIKNADPQSATKKLKNILEGAQHSGAQQFMVTCTSTGRLIDSLNKNLKSKIVRIEEAAVLDIKSKLRNETGRVGVIYTNPTVWPEMELILVRSGVDRSRFSPCFIDGAFENVLCGNIDNHDKIISEYMREHGHKYAALLLAQVSVCNAMDRIETSASGINIISIAELGIERVKERYNA